ncbi:MAG TPA: DUF3592 domain-containing protein [Solirubrobacterales bacterium]|nr:DUF3592 domain-containing protein [Solirubrobacterales bacterium]
MFVIGVLMGVAGLAMIIAGVVVPVDAARPGLIGGGIGVGLAGLLLAYLDAPERRKQRAPGTTVAKATILDAAVLPGSVAGYQMVELTLEVRPKDGTPFQAKRKFSSGRLGRIEQGRTIEVAYDPADPQRLDLA